MLDYFAISFGFLGIIFCGALLLMLSRAKHSLSLTKYANNKLSLADILIYGYKEDARTIRCKNGGLTTSWRYESPHPESSGIDSLSISAEMLSRAIRELGSDWSVHVDAVRKEHRSYHLLDQSYFPDPITRLIEEERAHQFSHELDVFTTFFILTLTWTPSTRLTPAMDLEAFRRQSRDFESLLSTTLSLKPLSTYRRQSESGNYITYDEQLSWLSYCVTGSHQPIQVSEEQNFLDVHLACADLTTGIIPRIGNKYIGAVTITGFPASSTPGILNTLTTLPLETRWSTRFIVLDRDAAMRSIEQFKKRWHFAIEGINPALGKMFRKQTVSAHAAQMTADAIAAEDSAQSGKNTFGYYTTNIIIYSDTEKELEDAARQIKDQIAPLGFQGHIETINATDAFLGSLPGHVYQNVRRPIVTATNLSHLIPTNSVCKGERYAPCNLYPPCSPPLLQAVGARDNGPFFLNLHVRDVGHTLVFGPTGAGKSTLLNIIAAQFLRYENASVFCFDSGFSMYALTKASGGRHYSVADEVCDLSFAPMQYLETAEDIAWATEWLISIVEHNGFITNPDQKNAIAAAVRSASETGCENTLTDVVRGISDHEIRATLQPYTVDGNMGHLLDATNDTLTLANFTCFEISQLMRLGDKFAIPVLTYLFRQIERQLTGDPTIIIIDEAWIALNHPIFCATIGRWLVQLRKKNCAVLMATQKLSDAVKSDIFDTISESTATKIYLANPKANKPGSLEYYQKLGLNYAQRDVIASATQKREYYYTSVKGSRLFDLKLGPIGLSLAGVSDDKKLGRVRDLEATHGSDWPALWLEECNAIEQKQSNPLRRKRASYA